jgi:hypothetical protein
MLYHCHELVHLHIAQHLCITYNKGEVDPPLDDHGVHSPQESIPTLQIVIIFYCNIAFLLLNILNDGFFQSMEKFSPPNGSSVIRASKLRNTTFILALHALCLEVYTLFRDAEKPSVLHAPMSTKILTKDFTLCFILHASGPDFYLVVKCHV